MEIYERIRLLRKEHLHLSQEAFGERLGVSRSVIKNIELDALARPDQKLSLIKLICKEFSISENWLLYGEGEMEVQPDTFSLDDFAKQHDATELELSILKAYFELDPDLRGQLVKHFKDRISAARTAAAVSVEDAEELYKKSRSNSAQSMGSSASNITGGTAQNAKEA